MINVMLKTLLRISMKKAYVIIKFKIVLQQLRLKPPPLYRTLLLNGLKTVVRDLEKMNVSIVAKKVQRFLIAGFILYTNL
jgi:hypothetical protein